MEDYPIGCNTGFKGQADLHCKGVRTQSLEELIEYWEWVWLSQRSSWSSALCYFCEEKKRRMRDNMRRTAKKQWGKKSGGHGLQRSCHFPMWHMRLFTVPCFTSWCCKMPLANNNIYTFIHILQSYTFWSIQKNKTRYLFQNHISRNEDCCQFRLKTKYKNKRNKKY